MRSRTCARKTRPVNMWLKAWPKGWLKMRTALSSRNIRKMSQIWIRSLFCPHEDRELVVTNALVTTETVVERCTYCRKEFGKPKLET